MKSRITLRATSMVSSLLMFALCGAGCSTTTDDSEDTGDAITSRACPNHLIELVRDDSRDRWFTPNIDNSCSKVTSKEFRKANELEAFLAPNPFVNLGRGARDLGACMDAADAQSGQPLSEPQRSAVVADYYYLMNSLKLAYLASLEAIAGLDLMLQPGTPPLPEVAGFAYSHPLIDESTDWVRRLRNNCSSVSADYEDTVRRTVVIAWQVQKLRAGQMEHERLMNKALYEGESQTSENTKKHIEAMKKLEETASAITASFAPWLLGDELRALSEPVYHAAPGQTALQGILTDERDFGLIREDGNVLPRSAWKAEVLKSGRKNPLIAIEAAVRAGLPKQLRATRDALTSKLKAYAAAADHLHEGKDSRISEETFAETLGMIPGFTSSVFSEYAVERAGPKVTQDVSELERDVAAIAAKYPKIQTSSAVGKGLSVRLDGLDTRIAVLSAGGVDVSEQKNRLAAARASLSDSLRYLSAESALAGAECRKELRSSAETIARIQRDFGVGVAVTLATVGVSSFLSVAKAGASALKIADAGAALAKAARASGAVARGAESLAKAGISFEKQAKVAWSVLLGGDLYWLGDGVVSTVLVCNQSLNHNVIEMFDRPFSLSKVACLSDIEAGAKQNIADYNQCALSAALGVGLNALSVLPTVRDFHH